MFFISFSFPFFLQGLPKKYEANYKNVDGGTSPCSPRESIQSSDTFEELCRVWRPVNNNPEYEPTLFKVQVTGGQCRTTDTIKHFEVWLDRNMKLKSYVDNISQ